MTASLIWQKSTYSQEQGECVELAADGGAVLLRESDDPTTVVAVTPTSLARFLHGIKIGRPSG